MDENIQAKSLVPKACEACRARKIRCNKRSPCSNCEISNITCRPATRQHEQRARVAQSVNYEHHIEQINDRLIGIEEALNNLQLRPTTLTPPDDVTRSSATTDTTADFNTKPAQNSTAFEGASSFTDQVLQASQAAETTLSHGAPQSAEVADALLSLRDLRKALSPAATNYEFRFDESASLPLPSLQLPPLAFVLALLRAMKGQPLAFLLGCAIHDWQYIEKLCQKVYFSLEPVSLGTVTVMNACLYFLIAHLKYTHPQHEDAPQGEYRQFDLDAMRDLCKTNFSIGVETYEILSIPSLANASALMMGMLRAQEECKFLLAWNLTCAAARQVLNLGWHRKQSLQNESFETAEAKRQVFWTIYIFDKNLALSLGYTPNMQDWDIDAEVFTESVDPRAQPWDKAVIATIELSRLQGLMYERLYSLTGLKSPREVRLRSVEEISQRFQNWYTSWTSIDVTDAYLPHIYVLVYGPFDVVYYSLLCSVHRASTTTSTTIEIGPTCYDAARRSLRAHLNFFPEYSRSSCSELLSGYVSWVLLYAAWTPLVVVFLHAIASSSQQDVQLLKDIQASLDSIKDLNLQCQRIYRICSIFCRSAAVFVESNSTFVGTYNPQDDMVRLPQTNRPHRELLPNSTNTASQQMLFPAQCSHDQLNTSQVNDMSMCLCDWLSDPRPVLNLWNTDVFDWSQAEQDQAPNECVPVEYR